MLFITFFLFQRSLSYSEDECAHLRSLFEKSEEDIRDLMDRNEQVNISYIGYLKEECRPDLIM